MVRSTTLHSTPAMAVMSLVTREFQFHGKLSLMMSLDPLDPFEKVKGTVKIPLT